jgi:dethiobiotin synthetase
MKYFVTATGTGCGKTLVSAIMCEALQADYWKPVQAGLPCDSDTVRDLISNNQTVIHPETYLLQTPASPHASAKIDGIDISLDAFQLPEINRPLVIEGAGGCLVPLNDQNFVIDLAKKLKAEIVLVSNYYLGSINHTMLTAKLLREMNLTVKGIVFNGEKNPESKRIILHHTGYNVLLDLDQERIINQDIVKKYAQRLNLVI